MTSSGDGRQEEVEELRAQLADLQERNAELEREVEGAGGHRVGRVLQSIAAGILVTLGVLCLVLSPLAIWGRNLVLNTDRYVETVTPVASDPGVKAAVVTAVNTRVMSRIDVKSVLDEVLEPRAATLLAGPLESGVSTLVTRVATRFVESDAFDTLWVQINRQAHNQIVYAVTGERPEGAVLDIANSGTVTLDISAVVDRVKEQLVAQGFTVAARVPSVGTTVEIAQIEGIARARAGVRLLNAVANWLPWIGLALVVGGVLAARKRRRAVMWAAGGLAAGMLVLALGLTVGRNFYLDALPDRLDRTTGAFLFDTLVRFLRGGLRVVFVVALLALVVAWLTGTSRPVVAARRAVTHGSTLAAGRVAQSPAGQTVDDYLWPLRLGILGVAALVYVLWPEPTALVAIVLLVLTLLALVFLELVRSARTRGRPGADAEAAATP